MYVIEQNVDIPAGREIVLKLPESVPLGRVSVTISISECPESVPSRHFAIETREYPSLEELKLQAAEKTARRKASGKKPFEGLCGIFKNSKTFAGDSVEIIRGLRKEWNVSR